MDASASSNSWQRLLLKRVGWTLLLKLIALILLYWAFFGPTHRLQVTPDRVDQHMAPAPELANEDAP